MENGKENPGNSSLETLLRPVAHGDSKTDPKGNVTGMVTLHGAVQPLDIGISQYSGIVPKSFADAGIELAEKGNSLLFNRPGHEIEITEKNRDGMLAGNIKYRLDITKTDAGSDGGDFHYLVQVRKALRNMLKESGKLMQHYTVFDYVLSYIMHKYKGTSLSVDYSINNPQKKPTHIFFIMNGSGSGFEQIKPSWGQDDPYFSSFSPKSMIIIQRIDKKFLDKIEETIKTKPLDLVERAKGYCGRIEDSLKGRNIEEAQFYEAKLQYAVDIINLRGKRENDISLSCFADTYQRMADLFKERLHDLKSKDYKRSVHSQNI